MNNLSPQLEQWLDQLRGTPSSTVNFEGLSANDVRAQCAMILAAVRTKLPEPEMWAIHAKYAATEHEETGPRLASGEVRARRYAFSAMKIHAIEQLVGWLVQTSALREVPLAAMKCMVAKFYSNHAKVEISFRALAQEFGGNHMLYARTYKQLVVLLRPLEILAVRRLEPYFLQQGIVGDQQACTV
ncbi:MAG TPA: hypothetical protein VM406_09890 [Noviherbaspirillum sp.]|nr:hypothetical protein [Noviherbaspirillum sp.]